MAEYARQEINSIGGYYAYGKELVNGNSIFDYDVTKLSIYTRDIGLAGIEVYDLLRDEYDIQIEFGDISNILAYISMATGSRISSGWLGRWRISSGSTARTAPGSFPASIFRPRWSCRLRRRSIRTRFRSGGGILRAGLRRVCHVLSAGDPDLSARRDDHGRRGPVYPVRQGKGLLHAGNGGPGGGASAGAGEYLAGRKADLPAGAGAWQRSGRWEE